MPEEENIPPETPENESLKSEEVNKKSSESIFPEDSEAPEIKDSNHPESSHPIEHQSTNSPETENMEVYHKHHHSLPVQEILWKHYLFEFLMLFLAVTAGFFVDNLREHFIEKKRAHNYFQSMLLDVQSNSTAFDSLLKVDNKMIILYDSLVQLLLADSSQINRSNFAKRMGAIWLRSFINRNETFEQMKFSGSLRYIENLNLLANIMEYERKTNFAQLRSQEFEKKYYTDNFLPTIYNNYDLPCQIYLDTGYFVKPDYLNLINRHVDIIKGDEAKKFRHEVGGALMLRIERLRASMTAYRDARQKCLEMQQLIQTEIK